MVLHLAAKVGGLYTNMANNLEFFVSGEMRSWLHFLSSSVLFNLYREITWRLTTTFFIRPMNLE